MAKNYLKNLKTLLRQALHATGEEQKARMRGDKKAMKAAGKARKRAFEQHTQMKEKVRGGKL